MDAFSTWLVADGMRPNTVRAYVGHLRRAGEAASAPTSLEAWVAGAIAGVPRGTATQVKAAVRAWWRFRRWDGQPTFPRGRRAARVVRRPLSAPELAAFYRKVTHGRASPAVRCILRLLPRTALRIAEACALRMEQVERRRGGLRLLVIGKGGHERRIPLSTEATRILRVYLAAHRAGAGPREPVFPGAGDKPIHPESVRRVLRRLRGRHAHITPHVLRHTWATRAYNRGVRLATLKAMLGHTSVATTQRYVQATEATLLDAVERAELR